MFFCYFPLSGPDGLRAQEIKPLSAKIQIKASVDGGRKDGTPRNPEVRSLSLFTSIKVRHSAVPWRGFGFGVCVWSRGACYFGSMSSQEG